MNVDLSVTVSHAHTVSAPGLESLLSELITTLKGISMDVTQLTDALKNATNQLNAATAELNGTKAVLEKVQAEETGLLVKIQTLSDLLGQAGALPADVVQALDEVNAAVAAVKAASADVKTAASAADALVSDEPAAP